MKPMTVMRHAVLALCVATGGLCARPAAARADVPSTMDMQGTPAVLTRLFDQPTAKAEWFAPAFIEEVPIAQVNAVLASVHEQFGAFRSVEGGGLDYVMHLARGSVHVRIVIDHAGLISGLLIKP